MNAAFETSGVFIADWPLCRVLLAKNARYPWLQLLPRYGGATELLDIPAEKRLILMDEIALACEAIKKIDPGCKLNIGILGNVVSQLHIHVVGRRSGDAAWPGPVWGNKTEVMPYDAATREARIMLVRSFGPSTKP